MKNGRIFDLIRVDAYSATPKYLQLSQSVVNAVQNGLLLKDDPLPSINELSYEFDISRDTAEKAYKYLKKLGVLSSYPGKGYFIKNTDFRQKLKICLLFNKLSAHKKIVYDSFVSTLGTQANIDFYIFNNDFVLFKQVLNSRAEDYSHYVIVPHFLDGADKALDIINSIPKEKLILLDKKLTGVGGAYGAVYENFEKDIFDALEQAREQLGKYHTIKIIFPESSYFPQEILKGFYAFCQEYAFNYKVVHETANEEIGAGEVYIILMEDDLVLLIERIMLSNLKIGKDVGLISYNDTPLKKIILNGITTISSDFRAMGAMAAQMIIENSHQHLESSFLSFAPRFFINQLLFAMKMFKSVISCLCFCLFAFTAFAAAPAATKEFYEIRLYHLKDKDQEARMDKFLSGAYLPALHKAGISKVGVFKPVGMDTAADRRIYVFIPIKSLAESMQLDEKLKKDAAFASAGAEFINTAYNAPAYTRMEVVLLEAFDMMPKMAMPELKGPKSDRIYELRSYESASEKLHANKVDMFNIGGEVPLFKRLGFNAVFYARVIAGSHMPNLMYLTTFENRAIRDEHWKAFSADAEWKVLSAKPEYKNNVSRNDTQFLFPAEYSDI